MFMSSGCGAGWGELPAMRPAPHDVHTATPTQYAVIGLHSLYEYVKSEFLRVLNSRDYFWPGFDIGLCFLRDTLTLGLLLDYRYLLPIENGIFELDSLSIVN